MKLIKTLKITHCLATITRFALSVSIKIAKKWEIELGKLELEYNYMSSTTQHEFSPNYDPIFIYALTRITYLEIRRASQLEAALGLTKIINSQRLAMLIEMLATVVFSKFYSSNRPKYIYFFQYAYTPY